LIHGVPSGAPFVNKGAHGAKARWCAEGTEHAAEEAAQTDEAQGNAESCQIFRAENDEHCPSEGQDNTTAEEHPVFWSLTVAVGSMKLIEGEIDGVVPTHATQDGQKLAVGEAFVLLGVERKAIPTRTLEMPRFPRAMVLLALRTPHVHLPVPLFRRNCRLEYTSQVKVCKLESRPVVRVDDESDLLRPWSMCARGIDGSSTGLAALSHLIHIVTNLQVRGVAFRSLTEQMDTTTPHGEFLFNVFGSLAQYERALTKERIMAGLEAAKRRGKHSGRPHAISDETLEAIRGAMKNGTSKAAVCRTFGVKRSTLYDALARHAQNPATELY
jgi:hypothetical protein